MGLARALDTWKGPYLVYTVVSTKPLQLPIDKKEALEVLQSWERSSDLIRKYKDAYKVESGWTWDEDSRVMMELIHKDIYDKEKVEVCLSSGRYVHEALVGMEKTRWRY